jgi:hypothetical protein
MPAADRIETQIQNAGFESQVEKEEKGDSDPICHLP